MNRTKYLIVSLLLAGWLVASTLQVLAASDAQLFHFVDGEIVSAVKAPGQSGNSTAICEIIVDTVTCTGLMSQGTFGQGWHSVQVDMVNTTVNAAFVLGARMTVLSLTNIEHYAFPGDGTESIAVGETICFGQGYDIGEGLDPVWAAANCDHVNLVNTAATGPFNVRLKMEHCTGTIAGDTCIDPLQGGQIYEFYIRLEWIMSNQFVPPYVPGNPQFFPWDPTCLLTATTVITDDQGVTSTLETPYLRASNLLANNSFETGNVTPDNWETVRGGIVVTVSDFYAQNEDQQNQGLDAVFNSEDFFLVQGLPFHSGGEYLLGGFVRGAPKVIMRDDFVGLPIAEQLVDTPNYQLISGTFTTGGGAGFFTSEFTDGGSDVWVDDVFVIPVVPGTTELLCLPEYFEPFTEEERDILTSGFINLPTGAAGAICYNCLTPVDLSLNSVSAWVAWLGCVLRNMFSCSLRVWLLKIENWLAALLQQGLAWVVWIPLSAQASIAWGTSWLDVILSWVSVTIDVGVNGGVAWLNAIWSWIPLTTQAGASWVTASIESGADWFALQVRSPITLVYQEAGTNIFDLIITILQILADFIKIFWDLIFKMIDLVIALLGILPDAMSTPPITFAFAESGLDSPQAGDLVADGANESKILWLLFIGMSFIDQYVFTNPAVVAVFTVIWGISAVAFVLWSLRHWDFIGF